MNTPFREWLDPEMLRNVTDDRMDMGDWLRDRAVPEKSKWGIVFIGAASAALWAILLLCAVYAVNLVVVS